MTSTSDFAVVICHGNYYTLEPYMPLVEALKAEGIEAFCPQLPTSDLTKLNIGDINNPNFDREPPKGGYPQGEEETEAILNTLHHVVSRGKKVPLVGHSAGG